MRSGLKPASHQEKRCKRELRFYGGRSSAERGALRKAGGRNRLPGAAAAEGKSEIPFADIIAVTLHGAAAGGDDILRLEFDDFHLGAFILFRASAPPFLEFSM